jgi:5-methylcytosine-specific restriction endonuclease McrA
MPSKRKQYRRYLESEAWGAKRRLALQAAGYSCASCQHHAVRGLHVHHLTYERFGNERLEDLQVLCEPCHVKLHGGRVKPTGPRKVKQKLPPGYSPQRRPTMTKKQKLLAEENDRLHARFEANRLRRDEPR